METLNLGITTPLALAVVAALGYLIGVWQRRRAEHDDAAARRELKRAKAVIRELESIARQVRANLATHHASIAKFKSRLSKLNAQQEAAVWKQLCDEAERMMKPTMRLSRQLAHAYDEIRQQTNLLMTFTEVRTDPLTGVSNRRALDDSLSTMFAMMQRYGNRFSVAMFDIDHFKMLNDAHGHLYGDQVLQELARLLDDCVRETDIVARYGGEEFVVLMPETDLPAAAHFSERMRRAVQENLDVTISGGVAMATDGDSPRTLLTRADSALYRAKASGRNLVFKHDGHQIEPAVNPPSDTSEKIADATKREVNDSQSEEDDGEAVGVGVANSTI